MIRLIDELSSYAHARAGRSDLEWEVVSAASVVEGALEFTREDARERGLALHVDVPPELEIETDRRKLHYILVNLLTNAAKFTPEGEILVRARQDEGAAVIEVQDTGVGVADEQRKHIFEPFWRGEAAARDRTGSGVGLSLTRRLVEVLGGRISVESEMGEGSTFRVRLPPRRHGARKSR